MDFDAAAKDILADVGGAENIGNMTHCATRLRLNLVDRSLADDKKVEAIPGVLNVVYKAGQYQVLIGTEVPKLYAAFEQLVNTARGNAPAEPQTANKGTSQGGISAIVGNVFSAISAIFAPLLPALAGSGILRGLLILFVQLGLIKTGSGTYTILNVTSMTVFYFLPVLLAYSSARRFGASPYISALIGAALIHPDFIGLMGKTGNGATTNLFGIPVVLMNYSSTVVPIILAIWAYSYLYKFLDRKIPENLKLVLLPAVSLIIMVPLTMIVIGPIGVYSGEGVAHMVNWLIDRSSILAGVVVGGGWSILVSLGIHWAINPIMINNVSTYGFDYIVPWTFACNFAVIGTTIGVWLKARDTKLRGFALTGLVTIGLSAIIEPTLFGMLVKHRKLWLAQIIGGCVGGAYLGLTKVVTNAFVFGSVTTFPAFVEKNSGNFINAMVGMLIALVTSAVLAFFFTKRDEKLA
ncbi:PTS transporter subunit EIIC [Schleiferilactobacillus perolens]|uniref:PTS system, beta-glucoside-specific IIABC component n=1 Tax=Schleiferilactobacillus perolens DSM 12744 TaxID=1423792 RepID=A0A0R1NE05_9LACO|nr:PTS transporter subunit EIIC [Schleiferilactobacillus perolens]KRL14520.1 PTS system, beta-glucoside-specific IIABC component [Schleiferilactobacillus perolens DSM 12744]